MEELCVSLLFLSVSTTPFPSGYLETIGTEDWSFLTALFRTLHWVFYLFFSTWSPEGICKRRAPVLTWLLTNKTLKMTAQLHGCMEGSNSIPRTALLPTFPLNSQGSLFHLKQVSASFSFQREREPAEEQTWSRKGIQLDILELSLQVYLLFFFSSWQVGPKE